jgi:ATP-dependent exoDNAse (exonuclease V) beta subunit
MDDAQLDAWLELAEIATDDGFRGALERQFAFGRELSDANGLDSNGSFQRLLSHVVETIRSQRDPDDDAARILLDAWFDDFARLRSQRPDAEFIRWLLDNLESGHDSRIDRYWELISKLKQFPYDPAYARAFEWMLKALRARASAGGP